MGAKTDRWRRVREIVFKRDNYTCCYCGKFCGKKKIRTIDHKLPKSRGGTDSLDNLVTACKRCNVQKGDRTPLEAGMHVVDWSKYSWHRRVFGYDDRTEDCEDPLEHVPDSDYVFPEDRLIKGDSVLYFY